jgi:hypothetical protein
MTYPLTPDDIANMSAAQGMHAYTDIAVYISPPDLSSVDEYGQPIPSTTETTILCAFVDGVKGAGGGKRENWADADIEVIDAEIYFSAVTPTKGGKIKILKRFAVDVINKTFEIVGIQDRGAFGFVCALKAVTL